MHGIPEQIDRYRIRSVLGAGGFGVVLSAFDDALDAHVAIKVLNAEHAHDAANRERFVREAQLLRRVEERPRHRGPRHRSARRRTPVLRDGARERRCPRGPRRTGGAVGRGGRSGHDRRARERPRSAPCREHRAPRREAGEPADRRQLPRRRRPVRQPCSDAVFSRRGSASSSATSGSRRIRIERRRDRRSWAARRITVLRNRRDEVRTSVRPPTSSRRPRCCGTSSPAMSRRRAIRLMPSSRLFHPRGARCSFRGLAPEPEERYATMAEWEAAALAALDDATGTRHGRLPHRRARNDMPVQGPGVVPARGRRVLLRARSPRRRAGRAAADRPGRSWSAAPRAAANRRCCAPVSSPRRRRRVARQSTLAGRCCSRPGADAMDELAHQLGRLTGDDGAPTATQLARRPAGHPAVRSRRDTPGLLVIDQFEELFTHDADTADRQSFLDVLAAFSAFADANVRVVLGMRADFYSACAALSVARRSHQRQPGPRRPDAAPELMPRDRRPGAARRIAARTRPDRGDPRRSGRRARGAAARRARAAGDLAASARERC